ncbi:MAG: SBBP repeat-containing protein, partial [Bacteroidia bacterium]|nr:SBBP repeat-containing protein [Bacteroidia bacterium]
MVSVFRLLLLCGVFIFGTISAFAASKSYQILSGFVENAGQFKNQNHDKNDEIKFQLRTQNMLVQLKRNGFNYQIRGNNEWQRIEVLFEACNWSEPKAMELLPGELFYSSSYDIGQKYAAHQYQKVYYKNLYDGIDLECIASKQEGTDVEFKYNFIIHPGANPKQILMKINGAPKTWVDESGSLCMQTISGEIKDRMPISYELNQNGDFHKKVTAIFEEINDNQFGILLGEYNPKNTLVVDPILWATYLGGFNYDVLRKLVVDTLGNSYCMGQTYSVNSISTTGAYQTSLSGNTDAFITKFSPTGTLIWATYFGGAYDEVGYALALSKKQELIIVGSTRSTSGIASTGAYQTIIAGGGDGFVAKFSSNGSLIWSTYLGWSGNESILNVCVDEKDDDINIIGNSTSASVGVFPGVYATANMGVQDVVLAKLSSSGLVKWVSLFGGALNDFGVSIKTDKLGNLYFNGYTFSTTGLATSGAWRTNNSGSTIDAFISIFDSTGQLVRSTFYGGIRQDNFTGLDLDTAGNIYAVGYTNSMDSISTPGSFQENFYGILSSYDMMLIKFNSQLRPIWGTYIGGKGNDFLYDVSVSRNGYIVCGGNTNSDSLATLDANQVYLTTLNYQAAYVAVFSPDGNRHYASYFTGNTATYVQSVATDMYNQIYLTGSTNSSVFITTPGAHQTSYGGATDAYLLKLQISYPSVNLPLSNNVLSASQQTCGATQPGIINGSSPSGGNGSFTYLWLHSTTGSTGIFSPAPGVNTGKDYQPGTANPQTWYKRWVYSGTDSLESNV